MILFKRFKIKRFTKKLKALKAYREHNQASDTAIRNEISYYHKLSAIYQTLIGHKRHPYAALMLRECLRAAATLNDVLAQYAIGKDCLEEAKYRETLENEGIFTSKSNQARIKILYEEAHAYLQSAEKANSSAAKQLRGLAFIHGWGVPMDKDAGFEMVIQSIEQDNKLDKVPQIFASIGLNKPEFFAALIKRGNRNH